MALGGEGRAGPPAAGSDSGKKRAQEPAPRRAPAAPAPPRGSTWPGRLKTWAANPTGPDWEAVTAPVGKINAQLSKAETEQLSGQSHPPASLGQGRGGRAAGGGEGPAHRPPHCQRLDRLCVLTGRRPGRAGGGTAPPEPGDPPYVWEPGPAPPLPWTGPPRPPRPPGTRTALTRLRPCWLAAGELPAPQTENGRGAPRPVAAASGCGRLSFVCKEPGRREGRPCSAAWALPPAFRLGTQALRQTPWGPGRGDRDPEGQRLAPRTPGLGGAALRKTEVKMKPTSRSSSSRLFSWSKNRSVQRGGRRRSGSSYAAGRRAQEPGARPPPRCAASPLLGTHHHVVVLVSLDGLADHVLDGAHGQLLRPL